MTYNEQEELNKKIADFANDPKNRKKLLKNPKDALKKHLNIDVPDDIDVVINENKNNTYHFTIPDKDNDIKGSW